MLTIPSTAAPRHAHPIPAEQCRVVIVSDALSERNGVGAYYRDLVEHLQDRVALAELVAPDPNAGILRGAIPMPGDRTQRVALPPVLSLSRRLAAMRPDVVVLPTPGPYGMYGLRAARRLGARVVVGFHTHYEALAELYWTNAFGKISQLYLTGCNKLLFRYASAVVVNSHEMGRLARDMGARSFELVGTPIPRSFLDAPPAPVRPAVQRVLFAGRLAHEKNLDQVLDAARAHPDASFRLAGDGPLRESVEREAVELPNVELLGWLDRTRMREELDECDVLVLPSHVEAFGTVALEGLARGRAVIVSARCGILDWPALDGTLETIDPGESLDTALTRVRAQTTEERARRAQAARTGAADLVEENLGPWLDILTRSDSGS